MGGNSRDSPTKRGGGESMMRRENPYPVEGELLGKKMGSFKKDGAMLPEKKEKEGSRRPSRNL